MIQKPNLFVLETLEFEFRILWRADSLRSAKRQHITYFCHIGSRPSQS